MVFNSISFALFFLIVFSLYLILDHKWQNRLLIVSSCIFYGAWNWKFLFLLFGTMVIDYNVGLLLSKTENPEKRKLILSVSLIANLSVLGFFKYFNFFAENLYQLAHALNIAMNLKLLHIILPIGISFYTFQAMGYTIDVYRKKVKPCKDFFDFAVFVTFFPQLVAGPIERAGHMLPQIQKSRVLKMDWVYEGLYLILFGLFQKIYVADNLAKLVEPVFLSPAPYNGIQTLLVAYAFAFQIFCDFAGYSNMARGLARLLGFDLMVNFTWPYFSTSPSEFWQRWHISLSTWLRDYLYIPLGGSRNGTFMTFRNLMITMFLGGLWHGASWTFVIWGIYHGALLVVYRMIEIFTQDLPKITNVLAIRSFNFLKGVLFFHLVCVGWIFFRAKTLTQALEMLKSVIFNFHVPPVIDFRQIRNSLIGFLALLLLIQIYEYSKKDLFAVFRLKPAIQISLYLALFYSILILGVTTGEKFIYFQF